MTSTDPTNTATNVAVSTALTVNFSEAVSATGTWATLTCDANPVAVTLGGSGSTWTITPDADLPYGAACSATVLAAQVADLDGTPNNLASDYTWGFSTIADLAPSVTSTDPADLATDVVVDAVLTVNFSEDVTASGTWATLTCDSNPVAVTLGGSGSAWTITPDADLPFTADCSATVLAAQVTDLDGTPDNLASDYTWGFTTRASDVPPTVTSTDPLDSATDVGVAATLTVNFSEAVTASGTWATLTCDSNPVAVTLGGGGSTYTIDPDADLPYGASCTATVLAAQIADLDLTPDNMVADYTWGFTTLFDPAPEVLVVNPVNASSTATPGTNLLVNFSEPVDVDSGWYDISCSYSGAHMATVTGGPIDFTIDPDVDFTASETCTVTLDHTKITDQDTNEPYDQMASDYVWSFSIFYDGDTVLPIAVVRAHSKPFVATMQGNVTVTPGVFGTNSFWIQDSTGGIYAYPSSTPPTMALGDVIKVKGTVVLFSNAVIEVSPTTSVTWISTGTVPDPIHVATNAIHNYDGKLIEVQGTVSWSGTPPAPSTSFTYYINDGSGQGTAYNYYRANIDMRSYESGQQMRLTGVDYPYYPTGGPLVPEIRPRYQSDVVDLRPPEVDSTDPIDTATDVNPYLPISITFNKDMDSTSLTGNFTVVCPSGTIDGTVDNLADPATAVFSPTTHFDALSLCTASVNTSVTDIYGVALASPYSWSFTTGELDTTPPSILTRAPLPDATGVSSSAVVEVAFDETLSPASLDSAHFVLSNTYGDVPTTLDYDPITFTVTLTPTAPLLYGTVYTMTVTADTADYAGNPLGSDDIWTFTTMDEPPMSVYFGDIHNHTSYSDGSGTPSQALAAGKAAGLSFMAITDHSYAIDDTEWANILAAVEAATDSTFVGVRGFEYTQGAEGHINVYNTERHAVRTNTGCSFCDYTPNLEMGSTVHGFYEWLATTSYADPLNPFGNVPLDSAGEVMQFNHPGWINFNDWFFHPEVAASARLEEVGNGNGDSYVFSEEQYIRSLDYGWKVGATNNADTHSTYWGVNTDHRTGVVMPELTKISLLEALRLRRTFATEDKNGSLTLKANGQWMGSEIPNTGTIQFSVTGADADGELAALVQIITDQGEVAAYTTPFSGDFTWEPELSITTGVHYYYAKLTQMDGDRIVTSPVWTIGGEDIAITDVTIQPTVPTTHNPSLLTVRVTNRANDNRTVTVSLDVDGTPVGTPVEVTVPGNADEYASFSWQPTTTGAVVVTAQLSGAPVGDNPDDNTGHLHLDVTDAILPLILIDAGHGNLNASGGDMDPFIDDLSAHHYNVLKHVDSTLTAAELDPAIVKLLIITAPETAYTTDERTAIGNFINAGGSLWMLGISDYTGSTAWASTAADRQNAILASIETATGQNVNMRFNDDEVIDADDNNGYIFGVWWSDFPSAATTGIGMNVETISTWSLNSIVDRNMQALTAEDTGVQIVMQGDLDTGFTSSHGYNDPNHTAQQDADGAGDAYIYNAGWLYPWSSVPVDAVPIPGAAVVQLGSGAGRIMLYGDSNDPFTIFAYTSGDGKQNELFNLESVMWLLGEPIQKSTIAEARAQAVEDVPDKLGELVWVEGEITAAYGEFFNVLYVQDATGGITVHAPAGDIDPAAFTRGTHVRVLGDIDIYDGDTEIQFFEAEQVQLIPGDGYDAVPLALSAADANLESNEGWLSVVTGTVVGKSGTDTLYIDDGTDIVRVFLDGYNGSFEDINLMDQVEITGMVSEDGSGARIRVRNRNDGRPDDGVVIDPAKIYYFSIVTKQ